MSDTNQSGSAEQLFERALDVAEKHLEKAMKEAADISGYVAIAMIEAAVNQSVEEAGHQDIAEMLRDLADQIEADAEEGEE